jgi:prophage antirepressor-like protein
MLNNLQVFKNTEFGELGVLVIAGKEMFPATDCAKMLEYSNPHKAIIDHCRYLTKCEVPHPQSPEKTIVTNYIPEGDLFRLIVKSKLPAAERFERWVFDDVLPTIRKHGIYATDKVIDEMILNPDYGIKLFTELKVEREKRKQLELVNAQSKQIICELKPKASYYDLILQNKSTMPISKIAKDYGMSGRAFSNLLHELGVQFKMSDAWLLYQKYADQGYTQSKTHAIDADKSVMHTYWTQKGRLFIYDLLKNEEGILPVMEREKSA